MMLSCKKSLNHVPIDVCLEVHSLSLRPDYGGDASVVFLECISGRIDAFLTKDR